MASPGAVPAWLDRAAAYAWRLVVVALAVVAVVVALTRLWIVVLALFLSALVTAVIGPVAEWLRLRGWPPLLAAWTVYLGSLSVLVAVGLLIVPPFVAQLDEFGQTTGELVSTVERWLDRGLFGMTGEEVQAQVDQAFEGVRGNLDRLVGGLLAGTLLVFEILLALVLAFVLTFFFVKDANRITAALTGLAPEGRRDEIRELGRRIWHALAGYVRGSAVVGLADATLIGVVLIVLGVPLALPLIVLTFFGAFFPLVGAWLAGIAAAGIAAISLGLVYGLIVAVAAFVVQQIEGNLLEPLVLGRAVALHPVVILIALTAGGIVWGVFGALVAVPLSAATASVFEYYRGDGVAGPDDG